MSKAILVVDVDDKYLDKEVSLIKFTDGNAICCSEKLKPLPTTEQIKALLKKGYGFMSFEELLDEILGEE